MLLPLMMAEPATYAVTPTEVQECKHLNYKYVSSKITHIGNIIYLTPTYGARYLGELAQYWKETCANERYNASKYLVRRLSGLLLHEHAILTVSSMLIDVGKNLEASKSNIDSAILAEDMREYIRFQATSPVMPETGRVLSYSLRCVKLKMMTGKIDSNYCRYINKAGY